MTIDRSYLKIVEGLLFVYDEPLAVETVAQLMNIGEAEATNIFKALQEIYRPGKQGFYLRQVAGGYQFFAGDEVAPYLAELFAPRRQRLSQAALEVLSIVAYRGAITRGEVELIRGVKSDGPLRSLLEKNLIEEKGRKESPGRPILYGTTQAFLQAFGLNSLNDLPAPEVTVNPEIDDNIEAL